MLTHDIIDIAQEVPSLVILYRHISIHMVMIKADGYSQTFMAFTEHGTL
jgi:hypothetical protein